MTRFSLRRKFRSVSLESLEARRLLNATPQGNEFRVNSTTTGDQFAPAIAMDNSGNFVVVWAGDAQLGAADPTNTDIFAQRYNSSGVAQGGQFRVNTFTTGVQSNPSVAMDADGDFVVAWESGSSDTLVFAGQDGSGFGIYAQRYNAAGVVQGGEFRVNGTTANDQLAPKIATDANGNFVVVWHSTGQDGSGFGAYARRYNNVGTPLAGEFRVNTFTTDNQVFPAVAVDLDGDFVVTWTSGALASPGGQDGSYYGIYAQRYNASGVVQGGEFRVNSFTTDFQTFSSVAMDNAGDFVVSWNSFGQDGSDYGIYAQRYNPSGVVQGGEFRVNSATAEAQSRSSVDMDASGNFTIVWASQLQDGSGRGIYGQCYNAAGAQQGAEFRVNTVTANEQNRPTIALSATGNFVVAFQDGSQTVGTNGQDGSGYGIYARRYAIGADIIPPKVNSRTFNFATSHSITIVFSEDVAPSFMTADIQLVNLTTSTTIPTASMSLSYSGGTNPATVTFPGQPNARLPDGNYRMTLLASGITDAGGNPLDGNGDGVGGDNHVFDFFFLSGDANHDRMVNLIDFNIVAGNFGIPGRNFTQGDFNYDTVVNLIDFNILAGKFGTNLLPPTAGPDSLSSAPRSSSLRTGKSGGAVFSSRPIDEDRAPLPDSL